MTDNTVIHWQKKRGEQWACNVHFNFDKLIFKFQQDTKDKLLQKNYFFGGAFLWHFLGEGGGGAVAQVRQFYVIILVGGAETFFE